jgi:hypothetical protein
LADRSGQRRSLRRELLVAGGGRWVSASHRARRARARLPIGLSFVGPAWSEARLLAYGYAYEQATRRGARRRSPSGRRRSERGRSCASDAVDARVFAYWHQWPNRYIDPPFQT